MKSLCAALVAAPLLASAASGCSGRPCEEFNPAVLIEFRFETDDMRRRTDGLRVVARVDQTSWTSTLALMRAALDRETLPLELDDPPPTTGFTLEVTATALDGSEEIGTGSARIQGTPDACNEVFVQLQLPDDPDAGGGPDAGGPDAGEPVDGGEPAPGMLQADPPFYEASWVPRGETRAFSIQVRGGDDVDLEGLTATATGATSWLDCSLSGTGPTTRTLSCTAETDALAGRVADAIRLTAPGAAEARVPITLRVFRTLHVGLRANTCPHEIAPGGSTSNACNFVGSDFFEGGDAVINAVANIAPFDRLVIHDNLGTPAFYFVPGGSGLRIPRDSWLTAAPTADPQDVVLQCKNARALQLIGDRVRVEGFTIAAGSGCFPTITTWPGLEPVDGTGGHRIDRMVIAALYPERYGGNNIQTPLALSEDTYVSNSHIYGYWEGVGDLSFADRSEIFSNTFVFFQHLPAFNFASEPSATILARGVDGLKIANNVFVALPRADGPLVRADFRTTALLFEGNVTEGYPLPIVDGHDVTDPSHQIEADPQTTAELESPLRPVFLADAEVRSSDEAYGLGRSLDGVDWEEGVPPRVPGAFHNRSTLTLPRRAALTLGEVGCTPPECDLSASELNEVQRAVWSLWPGGVLDISPGTYAGNFVVSWPISIRGTGTDPGDVRLLYVNEDALLTNMGLWENHRALATVTGCAQGDVNIENLTIDLTGAGADLGHGVFLEGMLPGFQGVPFQHRVSRVEILAGNADLTELEMGVRAGTGSIVQDTLIHGNWPMCGRITAANRTTSRPPAVSATLINVTCRLTGPLTIAGFQLAAADNTNFVNMLVVTETATTAPLFGVQRRTVGDDGEFALDAPLSFDTFRTSYRGFGSVIGADFVQLPAYALDESEEHPAGAIFVSPTNHQLDGDSAAVDTGVDPATINPEWTSGVSLNGVDRTGRAVDRGAYEQ